MALRKRVVTFKICFRKKGYLERGGETMNIYIYIKRASATLGSSDASLRTHTGFSKWIKEWGELGILLK